MDYWKIQDIYLEKMKQDYEGGAIGNPVYKPYFQSYLHIIGIAFNYYYRRKQPGHHISIFRVHLTSLRLLHQIT